MGVLESLVDDDDDATVAKTVASIVQARRWQFGPEKTYPAVGNSNIDDAIQLGIDTFENACRTDEPRRYVDAMLGDIDRTNSASLAVMKDGCGLAHGSPFAHAHRPGPSRIGYRRAPHSPAVDSKTPVAMRERVSTRVLALGE